MAGTADIDDADATRRRPARSTEGPTVAGPRSAGTSAATVAGSGPDLEQLCNSCFKPKLRCACKRTRWAATDSRQSTGDTPMEGVEEISTISNHTSAETNTSFPPGLSASSTSSAVQPQAVQDPLHTGLAQSIQTDTSSDNTIQYQNGSPVAASTTTQNISADTWTDTASDYDPQQMYAGYVEDEFTRSGELIMAAHATHNRRHTCVPTWQELSAATDTSAIRSLLAALAFEVDSSDPWNTLGLSRLEGPTPNLHLLQSRRDVALKLIDSCTPSLHERGLQEMTAASDHLRKACDDCCAQLETNAQERRSLKGNNRNIPRWMEPSEDVLDHLATESQHNSRLALHLSNLNRTDFSNYPSVADVTTCRQLHTHLCGTPDEIERTLTRWGDLPLLTWAPIDNGQLLKVAAAARKMQIVRAGQASITLAVPSIPTQDARRSATS